MRAAHGRCRRALLHNDLEAAAALAVPADRRALDDVRAAGADARHRLGSGPTVFGLFLGPDGVARAQAAAAGRAGAAEPVAEAGPR